MWQWFYDPASTPNTGTGKIVKEWKMQKNQSFAWIEEKYVASDILEHRD